MTKIKAYLDAHPKARSAVRVFMYTFLSSFGLAFSGFLQDVLDWAQDNTSAFPDLSVLGKAAGAAVVGAVSAAFGWLWNRAPWTKTATYEGSPPANG